MQVSYNKLWKTLENKNILRSKMREDLKLSGSTMQKLKYNECTNLETIGKICEYLRCQIEDVVEIIYDNPQNPEIAKTEKQIAELQEKLQRLKGEEKL